MYKETFDRSQKDQKVKVYLENSNGSLSRENSNDEAVNGSESSSDSERQIDVITRGESGENNYPEIDINGTKSLSSSGRRSSSSSLSETSSDDFFRIDALKFTASDASAILSKSGKNYVSSSASSPKSEVDISPPDQTSIYQVYNLAYSQKGMPPTTSPPIQMMDRSERYESARIPSSIFERNNNPLEWSIASNDSLFSIHIGHHSFSREHTFKFGELRMSEELIKPEELSMFNRTPSIAIEEIETVRKSADIKNLKTIETSEESFKFDQKLSENHNNIETFHQDANSKSSKSSVSSISNESEATGHSFVPLNKESRRFSLCCNYSWVFCHHKWPICCYTWPSGKCSNCGWLFCSCCTCSHTKSSDRASPILTETERNSFEKTNTPRHDSYKEELDTTSSSSASCWHCFQSKQACDVCSNSRGNCCYWFHSFSCARCKCC
ncbi:uncharacterized protein [Cicer arietinum]|uniref:Uncharacterized protein LOC101498892 n=1 Tax=Cicer arietinum TaxID=3827 RepID=A0A1S2XJD1_CICAR|nr:uncharacterized protein LOC101498892 [Cicer arietinum]